MEKLSGMKTKLCCHYPNLRKKTSELGGLSWTTHQTTSHLSLALHSFDGRIKNRLKKYFNLNFELIFWTTLIFGFLQKTEHKSVSFISALPTHWLKFIFNKWVIFQIRKKHCETTEFLLWQHYLHFLRCQPPKNKIWCHAFPAGIDISGN